jgi:hypothetical protein
MLSRVQAQFHEVRLDLWHAWLRGRERAALRRLGEAVAASVVSGGDRQIEDGKGEIEKALANIESLKGESRASLDADRRDVAAVDPWIRPVVILRGICVRLVLRHRRSAVRRGLGPRYEALGGLAAASPHFWYPLEREVSAVRAELLGVLAERERRLAPFGGTAFPAWGARARSEATGFTRAVGNQLRSHLLPKAPALAGLAVGWWIANTYTDSHLRSTLRSIGIGSGGTRVVSSSTLEAMSFWLPLLAAALCAYAGERIRSFYAERSDDVPLTPLEMRDQAGS